VKLAFFGLSDPGKQRERNEDSLLIDEGVNLVVVADGRGGHLGGDYASRLAVQTCQEVLTKIYGNADTPREADPRRADPGRHLQGAVSTASHRIFQDALKLPNLRGMGTTVVALLVRNGTGYIVNVGDSRAYLIQKGGIRQLTIDHSLVTEQLQAGFITPEETKNHRLRNIITRSVGFQDEVETDLVVRRLIKGDHFLLCTDGLSNLVPDDEIWRTATRTRTATPKKICEKLVELANRKGGDDNVTVCFLSVLEG